MAYLDLDSFNAAADRPFTLEGTLADAPPSRICDGVQVYVERSSTAVLPSGWLDALETVRQAYRWGGCLHRARHRRRIRDPALPKRDCISTQMNA